MPKIAIVSFVVFLSFCVLGGDSQGSGSGTNGNLRLCIVEGRGAYKRAPKFCPVLESENSGVECVIGTDRLDCLRRMGKGTVDFGAFSPEDLVAAQWAELDVLVTNELKTRDTPFEAEIAALVSRAILPESGASTPASILRGRRLCHPGHGQDADGLSDTLANYLESLVTERSCDPNLSLAENRIRSTAQFFNTSCKAGPWVPDSGHDQELKSRYTSLCGLCFSRGCRAGDKYWGPSGALACLAERGDVAWVRLDFVRNYFMSGAGASLPEAASLAYLCRDGSSQPFVNNTAPCTWLHKPWPVIVAKRKSAEAVSQLAASLSSTGAAAAEGGGDWHTALAALLEAQQAPAEPLRPQHVPLDYLARARGFREAYSQTGCNPPRRVRVCTWEAAQQNKCSWLAEAGAVYGVEPPLECARRPSLADCLQAVGREPRSADALVAGADVLVRATRDYSLEPLLFETNPIIKNMNTIVAYVRQESSAKEIGDLRGTRASFPLHDAAAWHALLRNLSAVLNTHADCSPEKTVANFFGDSCVPGVQNFEEVSPEIVDKLTKICAKENGVMLEGEEEALRALIEGRSDVAFLSMATVQNYTGALGGGVRALCGAGGDQYCYLGWSTIGQVYAASDLSHARRLELVDAFTRLDRLFGKGAPFHTPAFTMYGPFGHRSDVLFHDVTRSLVTEVRLRAHPYDKWPGALDAWLARKKLCPDVLTAAAPTPYLGRALCACALLVSYFASRRS